jgi:CRP-like cAMP-binding protein
MPEITRNILLASLPPDSLDRLRPHLSRVLTPTGTVLYDPGAVMDKVYFPLDAAVSIVTNVSGSEGEVATVGLEGMVGLPVLLSTRVAQMRSFLQIGGTLVALSADEFMSVVDEDPALRGLMLRYAQALFMQVGQSVVCNQRHTLRQRCARWLLTTHDRVDGDEFHLTHEFLAMMLGVRRAGVTVAAGALQRAGLIRYRRGTVKILDREGLENVSCECYFKIRDAYDRIVGAEPVGADVR